MERWAAQFQSNSRMLPKDKAKCIAKLARWQLKMQPDLDETAILKITGTAKLAIEYAPEWYRAWHVWAIVNYKFIGIYEKQNSRHPKIDSYLVPAISGFIKSIALAPYDNLQDLLRFVLIR
jgi:FKBP12-rapamycin complex-associated protein